MCLPPAPPLSAHCPIAHTQLHTYTWCGSANSFFATISTSRFDHGRRQGGLAFARTRQNSPMPVQGVAQNHASMHSLSTGASFQLDRPSDGDGCWYFCSGFRPTFEFRACRSLSSPLRAMAITVISSKVLLLSFLTITSSNAASLWKRATVVPSTLPNGWSYAGCYLDSTSNRTLQGTSTSSTSTMTDESCIAYCQQNNYIYAGTEYSNECYCDNSLSSTLESDADCNMGCSGNSSESCGGPNRLTVFMKQPPVINPGPPGWGSMGCYVDSTSARTLSVGTSVPGGAANMSIANCVTACGNAGYTFAGTEYSQECCKSSRASQQ